MDKVTDKNPQGDSLLAQLDQLETLFAEAFAEGTPLTELALLVTDIKTVRAALEAEPKAETLPQMRESNG